MKIVWEERRQEEVDTYSFQIVCVCFFLLRTGIEPVSPPWKSDVLTTRLPEHVERERDSNPQPPGYEPDKLPLLYPAILLYDKNMTMFYNS